MAPQRRVLIGVDVGGTNTDAVVMQGDNLIGWSKQQTSHDVTSGVINALEGALLNAAGNDWKQSLCVERVHIGTTQFVNAVVQKRKLAPVAVIRLCGPASTDLPPFVDFPQDLKQVVCGYVCMLDGGYHYDGCREISALQRTQVERAVDVIKRKGLTNIVVSGVFSPINSAQEEQVGEWISDVYPEASVTLSHKVAQIGLLLRENSAILNESLKPLAKLVISAFTEVFVQKELDCPFFLTQNDGTLLSASKAKEMPVLTFAAGPTNSMRGAAFLSGERDGIVADIGGTSTDVGVLVDGFPRPASAKVQVGGVHTNFQMPGTVSIALGGGSTVTSAHNQVRVGPASVGYKLRTEGVVFGGNTLTTTDIAVASGHAQIGSDMSKVKDLPSELVHQAMATVYSMLDNLVNSIKISATEVPLILVGGGSDVIASDWRMRGISKVLKPNYYNVANAVGAALSQVAGTVDVLEKIDATTSRSEVMDRTKQRAIQQAIHDGADPHTVQILSISEIPLTYLPGNVTRIVVKAVGDLASQETSQITPEASHQNVKGVSSGAQHQQGVKEFKTADSISHTNEVHQSQPRAPSVHQSQPSVPSVDQSQPSTPSVDQSQPSTPSVDQSQPSAPSVDQSQPSAPSVDQSQPSVPNVDQSQPSAPSVDQSQPSVPSVDQSQTNAPNVDQSQPSAPNVDQSQPSAPNVDQSTGEWLLSEWDVECIAVGAGILGCGGGGSPYFGKLRTLARLKEGKRIRILNPLRYAAQCVAGDHAVALCAMGAPTVLQEVMFTSVEAATAIEALKRLYSHGGYTDGRLRDLDGAEVVTEDKCSYINDYKPTNQPRFPELNITALLSPEIGGSNAMEPLIAGADLDLPILDCDCMGRAFPELQMCTNFMYGEKPHPCVLGDSSGRAAVCLSADTPKTLENHFRTVCMQMGCTAAIVEPPLSPEAVTRSTVLHSLSRAWRLGSAVLSARAAKASPISAIVQHQGGVLLLSGKITDIVRNTEGGFARGQVIIDGISDSDGRQFVIFFQNEHLVVKDLGKNLLTDKPRVLATVPDLIAMVELDSGEPISTDEMRYGLRVAVLGLPASHMLTSPMALQVVSPQAFGYCVEEATYTSVGQYIEHPPIPTP